jgi:hypothetical protein
MSWQVTRFIRNLARRVGTGAPPHPPHVTIRRCNLHFDFAGTPVNETPASTPLNRH